MEKIINSTDKFIFPSKLEYINIDDDTLIVSESTGNWIVINKDSINIFKYLLNHTIEEVYTKFKDNSNKIELILKAILAQEFAGINKPIEPINGHIFDDLTILLTNRCNLKCKHCFMFSGEDKTEELTVDDWKRVILQFHESGGKTISFSGGEVLMYHNYLPLLKYANELGLGIKLFTNGTIWTKELIHEVSKYIHWVQISLDGYNEETNSLIRGKGYFNKALKTIIEFSKEQIRVNVGTTFDPKALDNSTKYKYKELIEKIKELSEKVTPSFALTKRFIKGRNIDLSKEENDLYEERIREIEKYINSENNSTMIIASTLRNEIIKNCGIGMLVISADGNVYACSRIKEVESIGNINNNSYSYFKEKGISIFNESTVDNLSECSNCYLRHICGGGCRLDTCKKINNKWIHESCTDGFKEQFAKKLIIAFKEYYKF